MKKLRTLAIFIAGLWCCIETTAAYEYTKAYDFYIDDIFYKITSASTVKVTYNYYNDNTDSDYYDTYYTSYGNNIPSTVVYNGNTYTVTAIGEYAFYGSEITSITIPNTVVSIDQRAFTYCRSLTSVTISEGVTSIGFQAFFGCTKLSSMTISAKISPTIATQAFQNIPKSCVLNYPVESFDSYSSWKSYFTFNKFRVDGICYDVTSGSASVAANSNGYSGDVTIPATVSFSGNTYTVSYIDMTAFWNASKMTSITIPSTINSITSSAFNNCTGLTSVVISEGVEEIGGSAFSGTGLTFVTIPSSVKTIGANAFAACSSLEEVTISNGVNTIYTGAFANCRKLTTIVIPESVSTLSDDVFANCPLTDITFHSNLENISRITAERKHLIINDASAIDFNRNTNNTFNDITYNRTIAGGKYGTIILPFVPDAESLDKFAFYTLSDANANYLIFEEVVEPQANTPYLCALREGKESTQITGGKTTIAADIANPDAVNDWHMVGSFTNQVIETEGDDTYYYGYAASDNKLHRVTKKMTVKPYRAYFTTNGSQPTQLAVRTRGGETTIIDAAEVEDLTPEVYYDLNGRRVDNPDKGIYIINGKKVIR